METIKKHTEQFVQGYWSRLYRVLSRMLYHFHTCMEESAPYTEHFLVENFPIFCAFMIVMIIKKLTGK
jgi:hypothetical protein